MGERLNLPELPTRLKAALEHLRVAAYYANDTDSDRWDFSVPITTLSEAGATVTDLRWLVCKGFVAHSKEVTVEGDDGRAFRSTGNLTFVERSCFVLTDAGVSVAQSLCKCTIRGQTRNGAKHSGHSDQDLPHPIPHWDSVSRRLQLNATLIKRFKWPATNQEAVLCAFQEEGWPDRIDDPLRPLPEQDSKRRLADTIKCLNRKQVNELIHFRGDGTGEGVVWEIVESDQDASHFGS